MLNKIATGFLQGSGFAIGFLVVTYIVLKYLVFPTSIGDAAGTADLAGIFAGKNPQRGEGTAEATVSLSKDPTKFQVVAQNELRNTTGKGAWTRIRNAIVTIGKTGDSQIGISTSGEWRNGSGHAHWQGTFTLLLFDKFGKEVDIVLLEENERTGPKSGNGDEYKKKIWVRTMEAPPGFWKWIQEGGVEARFETSLVRIN